MTVHGIVVSVVPARDTDDVTILKVSGYLDTTTASELETALYGLLKKDRCKIVVDLTGVTYISSAGWGIFVGEIKGIRQRNGDIKLASMHADVREVFDLLEFNTLLKPYGTKEEALAAFAMHQNTKIHDA